MYLYKFFSLTAEMKTIYYKFTKGIKYILIKKNNEVIELTYDVQNIQEFIKKYLKTLNLSLDDVVLEQKHYLNGDKELLELIGNKIVVLNGKLTTYKKIVEIAKIKKVEGFDGKFPKYAINKYIVEE